MVSRIFETGRLAARRLRQDDFDDLYLLCSHPDITRYMGDGQPLTREQTRAWIEKSLWNYANSGWGCFGVTLLEDDRLVGFAGFARPPERPGIVELIYAFHPDHWGRGYATDIGRAMCRYGFTACGLTRIEATVDQANTASIHVIEKIGMVFERSETDDGSVVDYYAVERNPPHN